MKFTEKLKAKKADKIENPAKETAKKEKKPLKQKIKDSMNKKYIKNGSYSVVISAVFIVIVLVVNMIVGSLPSKYTEVDVSAQKLYSITDDTKNFLKKLDKDVTIYQVVQSGSEDETIKKLLEKYEEEKNSIHINVLIIVEREGIKRILVGHSGSMIKEIGIEARKDIEELVGKKVYLELFVKTVNNWREKDKYLAEFGFNNE